MLQLSQPPSTGMDSPTKSFVTATLATDAALTASAVTNRSGLLKALTAACDGLALSVEELERQFGDEGAADWAEGYTPHCQPEFLRAFALAVSERLARERAAVNGPGSPA